MRKERDRRRALETDTDLPFWLGKTLYHALQENFVKGRQSALFLNRRGMAQSVVCRACGHVAECPDCAVKLTLHGRHHLLCHYCHYHISLKDDCPKCPDGQIKPLGLGTEMVQKEMTRLFPNARLARMDRDEITTREELEAVIRDIEEKRVDILIGTQMIAKGLDFPGLTLVGLVMADVGFNLPDFRASERSFQLLTQVSGRSGRHLEGESGQVIIQTYNPQHPSIVHTCKHDFEGFAQLEESFRRELKYPPYWRLAQVRLQGTRLDRVKQAAHLLHRRALALQSRFTLFTKIEVLGPSPAPLSKIRSKHRWHLIIKGPDPASIGSFCRKLTQKHAGFPPAVNLAIDMDSVHLL